MKWRREGFLAVLMLLLLPGNLLAAMQLIYPMDKSWVYRSDYLIIKTNDSAISGIKLTVNGSDSDIMQISSSDYRKLFQDILIVQPVWDNGKNTLLVEGYIADNKVQSIATEIFYNPLGDRSLVPKDFRETSLHTTENEKVCAACHAMTSSNSKNTAQNPANSPCATCHQRLVKVKYPHEPVANYSCAYCHVKTDNPRHGTSRRDSALCFECHSDKAEEIKKNSFPHGPVTAGYCEICHDPHGSEFTGFMRRPINEVCLSCHEKIGKEPHVLRNTSQKGHPLSGKKDISPKRKGKELSCVSCHDPHGGVVRYFLQSRKEERMALCQFCHNK
ncbi:doubled CXXCH motif protein [Geobacter sp. OR-1]|uniref:cytochrome c3 family protein n=1 Tax=Geobacter sp. OR-1 TaxID=1266765 RepID=UPI0005436CEB|nr:cytochrome c3 family protein [Geobacter sp. OR-1]GAM08942.1 doubled CXXCH motif protein [Geobacter sp. OR-1]